MGWKDFSTLVVKEFKQYMEKMLGMIKQLDLMTIFWIFGSLGEQIRCKYRNRGI